MQSDGRSAEPLKGLLISDGRPGNYHLAEGLVAAIERLRPVEVTALPRLILIRVSRGA